MLCYITLGGQFDFTEIRNYMSFKTYWFASLYCVSVHKQADMPTIRLWWSVLLLENFPARSTIERQCSKKRLKAAHHQSGQTGSVMFPSKGWILYFMQINNSPPILEHLSFVSLVENNREEELPVDILYEILLVVLEKGDAAMGKLSLKCKRFLDVVSQTSFYNKAHFLWLDSVVYGKKFSKSFQAEYRKPYLISTCLSCGSTFKDRGAGYWGNGKRGQLRGFYSEPSTPGYCRHFCALDAGCYEDF
ncbi:uncharacterized protein LOC124863895 isoform X2 [Girardinichthys multiradiatus]|uniref:uncharacterized protein LOC124862389 isoform X2 n=1 Tax=Girardinichthys multiradiatus TaxID=208333 RepID=UPI001FAD452F|nr:uncharacterized protein LOC124862389 isoform X2 [Girardinichthys multiradiatus]XP_047214391.1 uncharacterized protein LOC124863895 isoform X2 [Girardinichthys multiradiatus]